ncbi:uncharacterized protein ASPGLDRAFT_58816 [Aspergillus glaucus CBS 516.65]|uniref:Uncharacterized protein n=1 Tax=Aspergillus glaucus CBS 516.65 TaxID=1160497 RepID=A0A1L9VGI5_ASPGL|nr:hypothetical protein ASPGLDRAFT_58816 [Aspergillus glaucus CBS 516.65]OJJ83014.1 hypothetical protein ASPGLDRAFT_58816 [Aspergillus glaucus CBS 516.65]
MASLIAEVRNQASQIASMKKTIEAQDNQLKEHANDITLLQPYRDQAIADLEALLNDPLANMGEKDKIKRLQDHDGIWNENEVFWGRYGLSIASADSILKSPEVIRLLNFYADLECRPAWRMERSVCEETSEKRVDLVKWEALEDKSPFEKWDYQFLKTKMVW